MQVCLYHGVDLDGYCSAAIWSRSVCGEKKLIPMNYGYDTPWGELDGSDVTLVDFSLQPWGEMERLLDVASSVTWIDHHKSVIDEWKSHGARFIRGSRDTLKAACELAWEFYFPDCLMPQGVFLLGDYDCWRHSDTNTMRFQMGMRFQAMEDPCDSRWEQVLNTDAEYHEAWIKNTCDIGDVILQWEAKQQARTVRSSWFPVEFSGKRWMAVNAGGISSKFWDSVWDAEQFDGMLGFCWRPQGCWTVSLYSPKIDCGQIAKDNGGGGHAGAAGFQCVNLPFGLTHQ